MKGNIEQQVLHRNRRLIGDWLRRIREQKGYTQQEFADMTNLSRPTVSKIEAGQWNIGTDYISIYAHHLEVDLEKIFGETELK